ncbi:MAG: hypothetical protein AB2A00_01660 [Myxococcota bacterium]
MDAQTITYRYLFTFRDGRHREFVVNLDPDTLALKTPPRANPPEWTRMDTFRCHHCPLPQDTAHCPMAVALEDLIEFFAQSLSYEEAEVSVEGGGRTIMKHTSVQAGMSSLLGLYMATAGCPVMDMLRPMSRFHLPFASLDETKYRAISMYLTAQFFRARHGLPADWELKDLARIYADVREVNLNICQKLSNRKVKDASLNAVSILDTFAEFTRASIDYDMLEELEGLFAPYLKR